MGNAFRCRPSLSDANTILLSELGTGDVLCVRDPQFAHAGACLSQNVLCWEVNHCGMALNSDDFGVESVLRCKHPEINGQLGNNYVLHALETGVKVWNLEVYLKRTLGRGYSTGAIWVRQLQSTTGNDASLRARVAEATDEVFADIHARPYEKNYCSMINAYFDTCEFGGLMRSSNDTSSLFCSELLAFVFQSAGILEKDRPADEFTPSDFLNSDGQRIECTRFCAEVCFGPPRMLLLDKSTI
eukprot:TRINITY_DN44437_c0_g1_i1.p1 TRINITY_DN44437_c0_g1~~TRINITY_DN44437_c0_g1_i1.p1  ORF type:complete len:243 (+),score=20.08 TRINITY_DN44437_c0_g1_i1:63-791(+)